MGGGRAWDAWNASSQEISGSVEKESAEPAWATAPGPELYL